MVPITDLDSVFTKPLSKEPEPEHRKQYVGICEQFLFYPAAIFTRIKSFPIL